MKAALDYRRLGWSVIPIESRGKRPLLHWQVYQHRQPHATEVAEWFRQWPGANLAIVTGAVSGLVVLDLDPRHGGDAGLEALERRRGAIAETVEVRTGGGGRHLYFYHAGDVVHNRVGIAPGVDLRGDGGYVVAPPSVHASGEAYRWERSPEVCRLAQLPDWLVEASELQSRRGHPLSHWRHLLREGVEAGERNNTIASLAGHLLWRGVDPEIATELLLTWNATCCRPPLEPEEVVRTVESITRLHQRGEGE
ncbi:MAG: bifunctional DNA primase/polymerase [Thiohalocapsa sp.]|uniref:bifunctional DNA primase/polymerase n=1 Tax=Thiohalocapsa sp. TaxID=2497641 RepID=UPI0025D26B48|nr:bifunctional DNA primase/polymerase [Thiohalocapsa sp.]MCG6942708.1 bifunctional DNA primase/polymerase [Thiohalocapsa sp.]